MDLLKKHWEQVYLSTPSSELGWFEESPQPSIDLLEKCHLDKNARILNVGAGTTKLIDFLLEERYTKVLATDISESALDQLKQRLGDQQSTVTWIVDDLTHPNQLNMIERVDLWHDRAVLHFFTEEKDQQTYFDLLRKLVTPGGYVIIAAFSLTGARKCSGLSIKNYSSEMLEEMLGKAFKLIDKFDYLYTTPGGIPRDYIYTLFKRNF